MVHNFLSSLSRFADGVCLFKTEQKAFLRLTDDFFPAYNGHDLFALHCIQKNADARSPVQTEQAMPAGAWGRAVQRAAAECGKAHLWDSCMFHGCAVFAHFLGRTTSK